MTNRFLYPRTISVKRPNASTAAGYVGYAGDAQSDESLIASFLPANVAIATSGRVTSTSGVPSDSPAMKWKITLPATATRTLPLIVERDVVYDDLGRRFQVTGYEPSPLGARIDALRLMA